MQARDKRILNLLSEKAEKGDKQAQAVHDYLIPIFEQADKIENLLDDCVFYVVKFISSPRTLSIGIKSHL